MNEIVHTYKVYTFVGRDIYASIHSIIDKSTDQLNTDRVFESVIDSADFTEITAPDAFKFL